MHFIHCFKSYLRSCFSRPQPLASVRPFSSITRFNSESDLPAAVLLQPPSSVTRAVNTVFGSRVRVCVCVQMSEVQWRLFVGACVFTFCCSAHMRGIISYFVRGHVLQRVVAFDSAVLMFNTLLMRLFQQQPGRGSLGVTLLKWLDVFE